MLLAVRTASLSETDTYHNQLPSQTRPAAQQQKVCMGAHTSYDMHASIFQPSTLLLPCQGPKMACHSVLHGIVILGGPLADLRTHSDCFPLCLTFCATESATEGLLSGCCWCACTCVARGPT